MIDGLNYTYRELADHVVKVIESLGGMYVILHTKINIILIFSGEYYISMI